MSDDTTITVEVESPDDPPSESNDTVVVVTGADESVSDVDLDHEHRITVLETVVADLQSQVLNIGVTAEVAESLAETAVESIEEVAEQTEEALATVAEEADAVTPEVMSEVDDVAPNRDHPWFANRSFKSLVGDRT